MKNQVQAVGRRSDEPALLVEDLRLSYRSADGDLKILRGVTLEVRRGEAVGLVGESGSGKSTLARAVTGLLSSPEKCVLEGRIALDGISVAGWNDRDWEGLRGGYVAMMFQDPMSYLNPLLKLEFQIGEAVRRHDPTADVEQRVGELLGLVQLTPSAGRGYPHQLSGGMRQRGLLAMALGCRPKLLIADEPTTAVDASTQAELLKLLADLRERLHLSMLFISHDLGVVSAVCSRVYVIYAGQIMESGAKDDIFLRPAHPYTQGLLRSARALRGPDGRFATITGDPPSPLDEFPGCPFAPRCQFATGLQRQFKPPLTTISAGHMASCWLLSPEAADQGAR